MAHGRFVMWKRPFLPFCLALLALTLAWHGVLAQEPRPTPTIDRLAAPPTVPSPTQADEGAYLYWLNCQPCHGDRGQGLTDEWRAQYPEEDQFCWNSGCHGERPYENGFTLPRTVPAVIGEDSLRRFQTAGQMFAYIRVTMPYEYPGVLPAEEYLAIAAFLLRENHLWAGATLTQESVNHLALWPEEGTPLFTTGPTPALPPTAAVRSNLAFPTIFATSLAVIALLLGGVWIWRRKTP